MIRYVMLKRFFSEVKDDSSELCGKTEETMESLSSETIEKVVESVPLEKSNVAVIAQSPVSDKIDIVPQNTKGRQRSKNGGKKNGGKKEKKVLTDVIEIKNEANVGVQKVLPVPAEETTAIKQFPKMSYSSVMKSSLVENNNVTAPIAVKTTAPTATAQKENKVVKQKVVTINSESEISRISRDQENS